MTEKILAKRMTDLKAGKKCKKLVIAKVSDKIKMEQFYLPQTLIM